MLKDIIRYFTISRIKQKMEQKFYWYWNVLFFSFSVFYKKFKKNLESKYTDSYIFMPPMAIGDLIMFCSCIKPFKKQNPGKIILIIKNEKYRKLIECFSGIDEILTINEFIYFFGFFEYQNELIIPPKKGKINIISSELFAGYCYKTGKKFVLLSDLYKYAFCLNSFPRATLNYSQKDIDAVNKIWNEMDLNEKTIFIAPGSISLCNLLSKNFWLYLAEKLTDKGYTVIFNEYENDKYNSLFLPLSQVPIFVKKCHRSIFFRSGLADLAAMYNNNLIVIYPEKMCHIDLGYAYTIEFEMNKSLSIDDNLREINSINNIWGKGKAEELIFNCSEQELEEKILNLFREK